MKNIKLKHLALGFLVALLPTSSFGTPVSAYELISDPQPWDLFNRDLTRTRWDSTGTVVENNDATIVAENNVDNDFGVINWSDVSYRHDLTWVTPPVGTYLYAQLDIRAWGNVGGDDMVIAESLNLGALNNGTLGSGLFSLTSFSGATLIAALVDGYLNITIDKNANGGLGLLNKFSVYSSQLSVRYEPVPEPATVLLLGSGLLGAAIRRRRVS